MNKSNIRLVSLFVIFFITSCNSNTKALQGSEKPQSLKGELSEIIQTAEVVLPEKDVDDNWRDLGYGDNWICKGDTIIYGSDASYMENPFGYFEEIPCLENSMFFKDKGIYQKKVQNKDNTDYYLAGYEFDNTKLIFVGQIKIDRNEYFPVSILYADISNNSVMLDHNIHVGMNKNQLMNKFIPTDSIQCQYEYLVLFNMSGGNLKYIFSFDSDTLSHIKILSSAAYDLGKVFPWYESLKEDYLVILESE
ncbi:MAG: hypothetical protein RR313_09065 [Anaerovoracaceae bacterium]